MRNYEIAELIRENIRINQIECLEWAYEVAMTYGSIHSANSFKEAIDCLKRKSELDFPDLAGKLHAQR